jgi:divalent metal cation (Fe/Co/Zn/Cd) transporter
MHTTVERPEARDHTTDWFAGVAEDVAFIAMLFSGIVVAAAILALAIAF